MSVRSRAAPDVRMAPRPKRDWGDEAKRLWYKFSLNKASVIGLCIVLFVLVLAVFQPWLAPYPHHVGAVVDFANANRPPCKEYWMGTDTVGRDIMSRIFYAYRGAFTLGLGVLLATVPLGSILGLVAGYWKERWFSTVIMRVTDVFLALPPMILALCVCAIMRPTLFNSMMAMCVAWWPWYTRLTYGMATSLRNEMYVKSAELLGASKSHIIFKELLPNCYGSILTKMTLDMGWVILTGATLSFVGLGEQPPTPALGNMVSEGAKYLPAQWWISIFPALAIMVIVLGFNLMGDGIKDMLSGEA
ncbi:MAG: ABC transporter permease [Bacillota bacterium]|jgi:peptide/nickel transport system permease protein|nr:ABC transporter permease [Candidatus Fermentithermobacillaceae bacterium]